MASIHFSSRLWEERVKFPERLVEDSWRLTAHSHPNHRARKRQNHAVDQVCRLWAWSATIRCCYPRFRTWHLCYRWPCLGALSSTNPTKLHAPTGCGSGYVRSSYQGPHQLRATRWFKCGPSRAVFQSDHGFCHGIPIWSVYKRSVTRTRHEVRERVCESIHIFY